MMLLVLGCTLPTVCEDDSANHRVIDSFWGRLDKSYALFGERLEGASWVELGERACSSITASSDDDAVFDALLGMARELDDGHIQIESETRDEDGWVDVWPHLEREEQVRDVHLQNYGSLTFSGLDGIAWGSLGSVGYLEFRRLDEFSQSETFRADRRAFREALDTALVELSGSTAWIIDLRFNEGGWDALGLELASRFSTEEHLVWSTSQRNGPAHSDFSTPRDTHLDAVGDLSGPVVLLTSGGTFSAGETLVLALRVLPQVTVLGEPTSGHLSDLYEARLPNGWGYSYSGDRYLAADGLLYENRGIPVDIDVVFDADALDAGTDTMLEAALRELGF